jgi:energy-coupling factor transporter transmembrane protein EcfT
MIGFVPGRSILHRAHPYTPLTLSAGIFLLVFAAPSPAAVWVLVALAALFAATGGVLGIVLRPAAVLASRPSCWRSSRCWPRSRRHVSWKR